MTKVFAVEHSYQIKKLLRVSSNFPCVLINKIILFFTAAHCLRNKHSLDQKRADEFIVLLGIHDLKKFHEVGKISVAIKSINIHPEWNSSTTQFDADIAVLVLEEQITFNKFIQPICLIQSNIPLISTGIVIGYGKSEDITKVHENVPKIIDMPIHDNEDCFLKNYLFANISSKRTFCA